MRPSSFVEVGIAEQPTVRSLRVRSLVVVFQLELPHAADTPPQDNDQIHEATQYPLLTSVVPPRHYRCCGRTMYPKRFESVASYILDERDPRWSAKPDRKGADRCQFLDELIHKT